MNQLAFDTLTRIDDYSDVFVLLCYFFAFVSLLAFSCILAEAIHLHWANARYLRSIRCLVRHKRKPKAPSGIRIYNNEGLDITEALSAHQRELNNLGKTPQ